MRALALALLLAASCDSAVPYIPEDAGVPFPLPENPCRYSEIWTNGALGFLPVVDASHDADPVTPGIQLDIWARFLKVEPPVVFQFGMEVERPFLTGRWYHALMTASKGGETLFLARSPTRCPDVALVTVVVMP